jgi:catechol 2,3-dioxygenase-like lactoylglutathione lyase family enzyme
MNRVAATIVALFLCAVAGTGKDHQRPKILGIASLHFYSTNLPAARTFYSQIIDPGIACTICEGHDLDPILIELPSGQSVSFTAPQGAPPPNLLAEVVLATDDVEALRKYLAANKVKIDKRERPNNADNSTPPVKAPFPSPRSSPVQTDFTVTDPDGHRIGFIQVAKGWSPSNTDALRIIHAGFIVNDRSAEDHFYKDILGFHLYWHGGMKDGVDNWVAMQVPDGTDWIEYMLNIPANASKHTLGVMNHMALGVTNIHATQERIIANGAKPAEQPKVGRDGKWQLNLYDPDETRTEFMEFTPKEKPCCSEFTGTHPGPQ